MTLLANRPWLAITAVLEIIYAVLSEILLVKVVMRWLLSSTEDLADEKLALTSEAKAGVPEVEVLGIVNLCACALQSLGSVNSFEVREYLSTDKEGGKKVSSIK
jgi:hypothetical protein